MLASMIFLLALLSLISNLYCWQDIRRGRPHIISLRQITLVMDRNIINRIFGEPEPGYVYPLSPWVLVRFIRARRFYVWREAAADIACMIALARLMSGAMPPALEEATILLTGFCQGVGLAYSLWLVWKWGYQIREELEDME